MLCSNAILDAKDLERLDYRAMQLQLEICRTPDLSPWAVAASLPLDIDALAVHLKGVSLRAPLLSLHSTDALHQNSYVPS